MKPAATSIDARRPGAAHPNSSAPAVDIVGLTKSFGRGRSATRALNGLDLSVAPGEVAGFLGPNGAGKSTTLRILLGMIRADDGRARLFGADPWNDAVTLHERLAYVPGDVALWPGLTGGQTLDAFASLRRRRGGGAGGSGGSDDAAQAARRAELIERFELDPSKKVRAYSKGNRQKVALIAALSEPVELLILDEPTSGLDPLMEEVFSQCVAEAAGRGTAVLLSSHILSEVDRLCDTVTIVRAGCTVESGPLERIRGLLRTRVQAVVERDPEGLERLDGVRELRSTARPQADDGGWEVALSIEPDRNAEVMERLAALGLRSLTASPPSLEELFLRHYGDAGSAEDAESMKDAAAAGVIADSGVPAGPQGEGAES